MHWKAESTGSYFNEVIMKHVWDKIETLRDKALKSSAVTNGTTEWLRLL